MEKVCLVVGAADVEENEFLQYYEKLKITYKEVYVIAADRGYELLSKYKIEPDLSVGDFDSLGQIPQGNNVIRHPIVKDDTDMLLAIKEGLKRECTFFAIFGGMGGRLDHTFGNLQILGYLKDHGVRGILYGDTMHTTLIRSEKITFGADFSGIISVFAYGRLAEGVTISGLKYELDHGSLDFHTPLGVSNEFTGTRSLVEVKKGELLIMWEKDNWQFPCFKGI